MAMYDKDGNYILTSTDKKNIQAKKESRSYVKKMSEFLKKNKLKGTATTYGFSTTDVNQSTSILKKLKIKYRLDYTPRYHVKVIISKTLFK